MEELCPRCESSLPLVDGRSAVFCPACGLPQLRVPEDALEAPEVANPAAPAGATNSGAVEWTLALRVLLVAALLGLIPALLKPDAVVTGSGGVLTLLLLPLLTLGSGAAYLRRRPYPAFTPGMGARMGATLALLLSAALAVISGIAGFVVRYGMHSRMVQQSLEEAFQQFQARMNASDTPLPPGWATTMQWPEMRAGTFLLVFALTFALLLVVGTVSGTVAGALLGGQQRRSRKPE